PVQPSKLVVLAIGVVVAALGVAELVAAADHRHALGEQQGSDEISLLLFAQLADGGVVRRSFRAAVPTMVVVGAVLVARAGGLVVLVVVADEVLEREAVVARNEVDAGVGPPAALFVEIAAAGEPSGKLRDRAAVPFPEAA